MEPAECVHGDGQEIHPATGGRLLHSIEPLLWAGRKNTVVMGKVIAGIHPMVRPLPEVVQPAEYSCTPAASVAGFLFKTERKK